MADATDEKKTEGQTDQKASERAARKKRGRKNIAEGVISRKLPKLGEIYRN